MLLQEPKTITTLRGAAAAAALATNPTTTPTKKNMIWKGVRLTIDTTVLTGTSITFTVNALDPITGNVAAILLASAAVSTASTISLLIYPGAVAVANKVANDVLPRDWNITTAGTHTVATYTICAEYLP